LPPRLPLAAVLTLAACYGNSTPTPKPQSADKLDAEDREELIRGGACPSAESIRQLHAAAFHFEHGHPKKARTHLDLARAALPPLAERNTAVIYGALQDVAKTSVEHPDADTTRLAVEEIRALFTDWGCLSDELHDELHEELGFRP